MAESLADELVADHVNQPQDAPRRKTKNASVAAKARGTVSKTSPPNGVSPKQTTPAANRKLTSKSPSGLQKTVTPINRKPPTASVPKGPSRPSSTADIPRSETTNVVSESSKLGPEHQDPIKPPTGPTLLDCDVSGGGNKGTQKKPLSRSERAGSVSPNKSILKASSKPSTPTSSTTTGRRPHSTISHSSNTAPSRGADRSQVRHGATLSRDGRNDPRPKEIKTSLNGSISQRSSTISASSSGRKNKSPSFSAASSRPRSPQKKIRPALGPRKSTMSVTIEQRLREMSLVHQMLHAAMAEEGDEEDEVKEAYGKQMDEQLAALKFRLEEARKAEGLVDSDIGGGTGAGMDDRLVQVSPTENGAADPETENPKTEAGTCQTEAPSEDCSRFEEEEKSLLEQLNGLADVSAIKELAPSELKVAKLELLKARIDYEHLEKVVCGENKNLQSTIESLTNDLRETRMSDQDKEGEVSSLQRENGTLEETVQRLQSNIDRNDFQHKTQMEALQRDLSQLVGIKDEEIGTQMNNVRALAAKHFELEQSKQCDEEGFLQAIERFKDRITQLQESSENDLSRQQTMVQALETQLKNCEHQILAREVNSHDLRQELIRVQASKDDEVDHHQQAIETLQNEIVHLNETQERELRDVAESLTQEHEKIASELRLQLADALETKEGGIQQQEQVESTIEEMRTGYQAQLQELRNTLESVHGSNIELRHDYDNAEIHYQQHISSLKASLERSAAEASDLRAGVEIAGRRLADLEKERIATQGTIDSNADALKQLAENVAGLRQQLTISNNEELALLEKNVQVEKELAATRALDGELREKIMQITADQAIARESTRELRKELERSFLKAQEDYEDLELEFVKLQSEGDDIGVDSAESDSKGNEAADQQLQKLDLELATMTSVKQELEHQLQNAKAEIEKHKTRAREFESALKVTKAELTEVQTSRPNGSSYSGSPIPKAGLRSSLWGREEREGGDERDGAVAGEESRSPILGQLAGMREHLRQIGYMNEDMLEEHERFLERISSVKSTPKSSRAITYRHVMVSPNARGRHARRASSDDDDDGEDS